MRTIGLFEAKQKFSELVERAVDGERIGITRRGKLAAIIIPAQAVADASRIFADIDNIRKAAGLPKRFRSRPLIQEGRI